MDNNTLQVKPVRSKDWISYQCQCCGRCCRHIKNSVMLESLDAYRLANYLRENGDSVTCIDDVYSQYSLPAPLTSDGFPVYLVRTVGPDDACIFLKDGFCSIYPARPRTCRIYPFSVAPGQRGRDFEYFLCTDKTHHLTGGRVLVNDWFYKNFKREDRDFIKLEYECAEEIVRFMRQLRPSVRETALFSLLYFRYYNYDLQKPFLPQYEKNQKLLMSELHKTLQTN